MVGHIIQIFIYSLIATILLLPVSVLDGYYVTTFSKYPFMLTFIIIIIADIISANLVYLFSKTLSKLVIRKEKTKQKLNIITDKLKKYGFWGLVVVASTPLPYSLMLYTAGSTQWGNHKLFTIAVLIGRIIKYTIITAFVLLGINIFF